MDLGNGIIKCPGCKQKKSEEEFNKQKTKKNGRCTYCRICHSQRQLTYRIKNHDKLTQRRRKEKSMNWKVWLTRIIPRLKYEDDKKGLEFNIDLRYLVEMMIEQKGRCKVSNMKLSHQVRDLHACSVDRIDNSKGHIKGNIQLVCIWVNQVKRHIHNNDEIKELINEIRATSNNSPLLPSEDNNSSISVIQPSQRTQELDLTRF